MLNTTDKIAKHEVGLLNLAQELDNISKAWQIMGTSRDTFYRYKNAVDEGGVEALFERTRRKPNLANRVDEAIEQAVVQSATDFPAYGQTRASNELRKKGLFVFPSGVRSIWLRHDLGNFKLRLKALEAKVASEGGVLTEAQLVALEKKKLGDEECGEIDTALIDADLGFDVYKQRIARPGEGRSGGYRVIILLRVAERAFFVHGLSKNERGNISDADLKHFRELAEQTLSYA